MASLPGMQVPQSTGYVAHNTSELTPAPAAPSVPVALATVASSPPVGTEAPQQQQPAQQQAPAPQPTVVPPPPQLRVVLQNVTASVSIGIRLDPASLASKVRNAEYNPKKLQACVMRIREPRATGLIFGSGKLVVTGATGVAAAEDAARKFIAVIKSLTLKPQFVNFNVLNMVATVDVGYPIDLELLAYSQARWCLYEPELFPGVIYQTTRRGVVAHIFIAGRVVLTGAKSEDHLNDALPMLLPILAENRRRDTDS